MWHYIDNIFDRCTQLTQMVYMVTYKQIKWHNVDDHFDSCTKLTQKVHTYSSTELNTN